MTPARWQPPEFGPQRGRFDSDAGVLTLPDGAGLTTRPSAAPFFSDETKPWSRPPASICFPLHPAGVVELHSRAAASLGPVLDAMGSERPDPDRVRRQLWQAACSLYKPGAPVRSALDEFAEGAHRLSLSGVDGTERLAATRTGLLVAWAVVRAAIAWVAEA